MSDFQIKTLIPMVAGYSSTPDLTICVAALSSRGAMFQRLFERFKAQVGGHAVELLYCEDDGSAPAGLKRQALLNAARGRYVSFVDDDDLVSSDYIHSICFATKNVDIVPDVITFDLDYTDIRSGRGKSRWRFGLDYADRIELGPKLFGMTANHLCAWKREIAIKVPYSAVWYGDDLFWYKPLHAAGFARVESHISKPLYEYIYRPKVTRNQARPQVDHSETWSEHGVDAFRLVSGGIAVATRGREITVGRSEVEVRLPGGRIETMCRDHLMPLCTIHLPR